VTNFSAAREPFARGFLFDGIATREETRACIWLAAALWWLAQQGLFALGWIALLPLFVALNGKTARARFFLGWKCGWIAYAAINWWIVPTVIKGSPMIGAPPAVGFFLGLVSIFLIGAIHGSLVALVALAWNPARWRRAAWLLPLFVAVLWGLLDAARLETPLAHGWGALAYSQSYDTALLPHARWLGQHGLSALCVWCAACGALWLTRVREFSCRLWLMPVGALVLLHISGPLLQQQRNAQLRVQLIQTDVPSLSKNFAMSGESTLQQALRLSRDVPRDVDLIVWPETTFNAGRLIAHKYGRDRPYLSPEAEAVAQLARETGANILCGANARDSQSRLLNAAILFSPSGEVSWTAKSRLVPFGERAPFGELIPLLRRFAPDPEAVPPEELRPLSLRRRDGRNISVGAIVCFESCFRYPARALVKQGAQALFVLTNDEWFAGTTAPREHRAMLAIRAAENGVSVAQSANGGITSAVDPQGAFLINGTFGAAQSIVVSLP
jgi:apolipoprotein N-acyltransferase